jgi:CRP/FNR family transcriptional regulator, cyclic AMP receptor protein
MTAPEAAGGPILAVLNEKDRQEILRDARRRTFAPGEVVIREGDSALNLFIVLSGHARVESAGGAAPDMGPGTFFGELGIIEQHPRTATVVAVDELTCLLLPAWEFRSLLDEHPEMAVPMLRVLIARLHGLSPHEH